ncbi:hypothetical protein DUZ99_13985 [Xylanibacillus composti]|uniref:SLH domain-containing protein n=1 Tax=Xylanibacillus composti TaxID=1572762 RepID=A0A8J4M249_9BACL|nr:S-layer homology domain-containing protein [Xylanibacillus composti]MDT9726088.1 hypothetical protein [Xylanibacillus composti]GIQ68765.1 hypothetical protein XYCOK13_15890 [Xylanibacillus composti]
MTENWSEADLKTWRSYLALCLSFMLAFGGFFPGVGLIAEAAPSVGGLPTDKLYYDANEDPLTLAPNVSLSVYGDEIFADGYLRFDINGGVKANETLALRVTETPIQIGGALLTSDGHNIYLNGVTIGSVNTTDNGVGNALQIDFSTPLENGNFEEFYEVAGRLQLPGWEINSDSQIFLGELATKTKGIPYESISGSGPYTVTGSVYAGGPTYTYTTDEAYPGNQFYEGQERPLSNPGRSIAQINIVDNNHSLELGFTSGSITGTRNVPPFGTAFRAEAVSADFFEAKRGDRLAFDWKAAGQDDNYEVYGFIVDESGNHIELMYGRGQTGDWTSYRGEIPHDGRYKFRFVVGSYDKTGGLVLGASLEIDNVRLLSSAITDKVAESVARLVTYSNDGTAVDPLQRQIDMTLANSEGDTYTIGGVTVVAEPRLKLLSAIVEDEKPGELVLTFNLPVGNHVNDVDLDNLKVNGLEIDSVLSVEDEKVVVKLKEPAGPGELTLSYDAERDNVQSVNEPDNKLPSMIADNLGGPVDNQIIPLELERIQVIGEEPYNTVDLVFNKPVGGAGLEVGKIIPGFEIGGKSVTVEEINGNIVRVKIDGTLQADDQVTYDADNGIADANNRNNTLAPIEGENPASQPDVTEDPLQLVRVEVEHETPNQVKLTFNYPIDDASFNWTGFEINGLTPIGKLSPDDNDPVVVLELPEPLGPEELSLIYDKAKGSVGSYYNPATNLLDNIGAAEQPDTVANKIRALELVRVTTDPNNPAQLKLKFNMPIATDGLAPGEAIAGLTVGDDKKPVYYVGSNGAGDEITVRLDAPYVAGDELAYDETAGDIAAAGNVNNELGNINLSTIPMVSGKISEFGLELNGEPLVLLPDFDPDKNNGNGEGYLAVVPNDVTSVSISPTPYNVEETVTKVWLNGVEVVKDSVDGWDWSNLGELQEGRNEIKVQVFDQTDLTAPLEEYTIVIVRATGKLINLESSHGQLSPAFDADAEEQDYEIRVGNAVRSIALTATALDPGAQIVMSINDGEAIPVVNGDASESFSLRVGTNTILVTVTDSSGQVTEYTVTVIRSGASSGGGGPVTESVTVDVIIGGDKEADIVKVDIHRTRENGSIHDRVAFTPEKAEEAAQKAAETGESIARIVIPDPEDEVSELQVDIPLETLKILQDSGIDLEIYTDHGVIQIPRTSLEGLEEEFYFRLVPVRDPNLRSEVEERATTERIVREMAGNKEVYVVTRPMTIETNLSSRPVTLILPLRDVQLPSDAAEREQFLSELSIFIEHTDGDKALVQGKPVRMNDGTWGLQFGIAKFSTFTIVHTASDGRHESYMNGYPDGTFKPENGLTRAELAMILDNLGAAGSVVGEGYSDVADTHWAATAIKRVQAAELMTGYPDATFRPDQMITRAEMAAFAFNYLNLQAATEETTYSDVSPTYWAHGFIAALTQEGWMEGYLDGTFKPAGLLTRAEAVTLINQLFERGPLYNAPTSIWPDVKESHWAFRDIMEASVDHSYKLRTEGGEHWVSP